MSDDKGDAQSDEEAWLRELIEFNRTATGLYCARCYLYDI